MPSGVCPASMRACVSFWEKGKGELDHIVSKSWKSAIFKAKNFKTNFSTDPYTYKLIRGIDFYKNFNYLKNFVTKNMPKDTAGPIPNANNSVPIPTTPPK